MNYINLSNTELDKPIFRIVTTNRLFELFEQKRNVLVNPKLWEDPFENYFMNSDETPQVNELIPHFYRERLFGQCWTKTRESDGIYNKKNGGKANILIIWADTFEILYDPKPIMERLHIQFRGTTFEEVWSLAFITACIYTFNRKW